MFGERTDVKARIALTSMVVIAGILAGCAGRDPIPVSATQVYDKDLDCEDIAFEIDNNNKKIRATVGELEDAKGSNVALAVTGVLLFWPVLFAMDLSDAEEVEIRALQARNGNLTRIGQKRDCQDLPEGITSAEAGADLDANRRKPVREPIFSRGR